MGFVNKMGWVSYGTLLTRLVLTLKLLFSTVVSAGYFYQILGSTNSLFQMVYSD